MTKEKPLSEVSIVQESNTGGQSMGLLNVASLMPMARANKRDVAAAADEAIAIVTVDQQSAAECFYSLPRAGRKISGPSVGLAETLASCWGNMVISVSDVEVGDEEVTVRGWAVDTQHGTGTQDLTRRRIVNKDGVRYEGDMVNTTIAAARSILFRNLVFRLIPRPIVRKIYNAACNVAVGSGKTFAERQAAVVKYWTEQRGISKEKLLLHLGHTRIDQINLEDIEYLLGIDTAIRAGDVRQEDIFRPKKAEAETLGDMVPDKDGVIGEVEEPPKKRGRPKKNAEPEPDPEPEPEEEPVSEPEDDVVEYDNDSQDALF